MFNHIISRQRTVWGTSGIDKKLTFITAGDCGIVCAGLFWQMHACDGIKAYAESLKLGVSQNSSAHLSKLHGSFVEHCVIGVVPQTVGYHEIEITFQVSH